MARIVIVGGGVIGCAVAERLSRERRNRVLLLERHSVGAVEEGVRRVCEACREIPGRVGDPLRPHTRGCAR